MRKYRVDSNTWSSQEFDDLSKAEIAYEFYKDQKIGDGVDEESYVELVYSDDDFDDSVTIKRADIVVDEEKMKISTPQQEGYEWDYWAKWEETIYCTI